MERYGHGGSPIVLLHGFGTSSFVWRDVAPEIALANRTAFAIDLFGYGESDRPFDADFGIASQAELVDRALIMHNHGLVTVGKTAREAFVLMKTLIEAGTFEPSCPVSRVMTKDPKTVTTEQYVTEAAGVLRQYSIDQVPVVDDKHRPIGLLDVQDLLALRFLL